MSEHVERTRRSTGSRPSRVLVTGAAGMVGTYVHEVFADCRVTVTDIRGDGPNLDVVDRAAVRDAVVRAQPDLVVHLAAATDVDRCEREPDWAFQQNVAGTENVALACRPEDIPLVYISTASVFRGDKPEPYVESDAPAPANVYGRTKLAGEQAVTSLLQRYYILRAGWMFGGIVRDHKFVGKIARIMSAWRIGMAPVRIVDDKSGSPTYGRDLLLAAKSLVGTEQYGLYHVCNGSPTTRLRLAFALRDALGRPDIDVMPVPSEAFDLSAPRGGSEAMSTQKLNRLGIVGRSWEEALAEYVCTELGPWLQSREGASRPVGA